MTSPTPSDRMAEMRDENGADSIEIEVVDGEVLPAEGRHGDDAAPDPAALGLSLPEDAIEARDVLLRAVAEARDDATSYLDDLRRVAADFDNFRKRAQREQQQIVERASERVLIALLPILDSFDAALSIEPATETEEKLLAGMRSTHAQLLDALAKEGLEAIPALDQQFDPEVHEAVMSTGEGGRLVVAQELRRGYRLRGKVIRASLVALEAE